MPIILGAGITLAAAFCLGAIEKIASLAQGRTKWHPVVVANPRLRRHAVPLIGLSLVGDVGVLLAVASVRFAIAGVLCLILLTVYTGAGLGVVLTRGDCQCMSFGLLAAKNREAFLLRNGLLAFMAAFIVAASPYLRGHPPGSVADWLGGTGVALVTLCGLQIMLAFLNRGGRFVGAGSPDP